VLLKAFEPIVKPLFILIGEHFASFFSFGVANSGYPLPTYQPRTAPEITDS
jgi:hypothetical protein